MKLSTLVLVSLIFAINATEYNLDIMSQAINDLIHELFIKNQINFDILMYGNLTCNSLDLINMIEMKNDGNYAENIYKIHSCS